MPTSRANPAGHFPPVPRPAAADVVVEPPSDGAGYWAGAPSAAEVDGVTYLAYRLRRPVGDGRGYAVVVARSEDGVDFQTVAVLDKDELGAESLERPAIVRLPDGTWRLYVSGATPGTLHWWVEAIDARDPASFAPGGRRPTMPGDATTAMKDPVVLRAGDGWRAWVCCHPLLGRAEADRMLTRYGTSADGLEWRWEGVALEGRPGCWDERGARLTSALHGPDGWIAYYDGRAGAAENYEERTGIAVGDGTGRFTAQGDGPDASSPDGSGSLRYVSVVPVAGRGIRLYYECCRADGAHDLRTELVPYG